jgi:hypothetical protein
MRRALLPVLLTVGAVVVPIIGAEPAAACSCAPPDDEQAFAASDAVFTGEVVALTSLPADGPQGRGDGAVIRTIAVTRVFKSGLHRTVLVATTADSTCTTGFESGGPVLVFAHVLQRPARLPYDHAFHTTELCGGSRPLDARPVPTSFGPGTEPLLERVTALRAERESPSSAVLPATVPPASAAAGGPSWWVAAGMSLAAAAVGAAAGAGLRRRRRAAP